MKNKLGSRKSITKKSKKFPLNSYFLEKIICRNLKALDERFVLLTVAMPILTTAAKNCSTGGHGGIASLQFRTNMIC